MLSELQLYLESGEQEIGYYQSSNLHGVIMQNIDSDYAEYLHLQTLNPYSQCIINNRRTIWSIKTLDDKAYQEIIVPLSDGKWKQFAIEKKGITVTVTDKKIITVQEEALLDEFYNVEGKRYLTIEFLTPTAFKSNGRYIIMPDLRLIYQSLMNKYSAFSDMDMYDEETLEQLVANSGISQYRLKSLYFPIERVKIPAFKGEITIRVHGNDTMARYIRLLMRFGEYSGVGIKSSMGMGAIKIKEDRQ